MRCARYGCGHMRGKHGAGCLAKVSQRTGSDVPCKCPFFLIAPLRSVVVAGGTHELYECGHVAGVKEDIYGPTNAYKRRCRDCANAKAPDPERLKEAQERLNGLVR